MLALPLSITSKTKKERHYSSLLCERGSPQIPFQSGIYICWKKHLVLALALVLSSCSKAIIPFLIFFPTVNFLLSAFSVITKKLAPLVLLIFIGKCSHVDPDLTNRKTHLVFLAEKLLGMFHLFKAYVLWFGQKYEKHKPTSQVAPCMPTP